MADFFYDYFDGAGLLSTYLSNSGHRYVKPPVAKWSWADEELDWMEVSRGCLHVTDALPPNSGQQVVEFNPVVTPPTPHYYAEMGFFFDGPQEVFYETQMGVGVRCNATHSLDCIIGFASMLYSGIRAIGVYFQPTCATGVLTLPVGQYIELGDTVDFVIRLEARGPDALFYLNGQLVGQGSGITPQPVGRPYFFVGPYMESGREHLRVNYIKSGELDYTPASFWTNFVKTVEVDA